ncbi:NTP transferase domain-containing protein [Acetobacterium paludosum]|uniref:NTP transferase domain-containing protein n=1 Tax=Acetobacterium paludosum TaxID=52693 RepID=A0A923KNJ9_9FIRM|nr:NTP transferase domain-containing protein [Acetobacterium paludosum]MBC3887194.1 NTP transferase domain-containing protein [Acetobacterium paludosum]
MRKNKIAAIIIAAGYSSRMDGFKPLLKFGNDTAVERVVKTYKKAGVDQIILVMGYRAEEIKSYFENTPVQCIINENFDQGMYTSIVKGLTLVDDRMAAFFIHPVDIPLVKEQTIQQLMVFFEKSEKRIIYPSFLGKRGHPPLIHSRYKNSIMTNNQDGGLKRLLETYADDAIDLPLEDESILMDMDTPTDYQALLCYDSQTAPNLKECMALLDRYQVSEKIRKHSEKVLEVSHFLLSQIKDKNVTLDVASVQAAAMLHDIMRTEEHHPEKGAQLLKKLGYEKIGNIISTHMDIRVAEDREITENEIVYLADKLVVNDQLVCLKKREKQTLIKYDGNPEASEKIKRRFENARLIQHKIEAIIGKGLFDGKADLFN